MLRVPKLVVLNLTTDCNMRCKYCYASAGEKKSYMTYETALRVIEELRRINNYNKVKVLFHGGEPLLCYDVIKKIINHYKEEHLEEDLDYYIQTNCVLLSDDKIKFFKENDVKISISIDGNTEQSNNCRILVNKENSIELIKNVIDNLNKNNVKINALSVLNKYNYDKVSEIIDFYVENKIYDFSFNYFIKGGRGHDNSDLSLSNEELFMATKTIINKIEKYYKKGIILNEKNVYYITKMFNSGSKHYMCANSPCGAGLNIFGITPNGDIFPCDDLSSIEKFKLGNINEMPLDKILESSVVNYFAECNYSKIKECQNCQIKNFCGAGCCSRKYYDTNSIYSKDPICGFYQLIYPYMNKKIKDGLIGKIYE
ncbi:MAG: radical SAM protein [Bacilli bacterium]